MNQPSLSPEFDKYRADLEFDAMVAEMKEILTHTTNPWKVNTGDHFGEDWLVATFGQDQNDVKWIVTTDHVRCSEYDCDAEYDARFCALAKQLVPELLRRLASGT